MRSAAALGGPVAPVQRLTMDTSTALFYVFSAVLLLAAFRVITARSPVYAALFLVLAFFSAACVWILLRAEFLAIALVLVYVGAVMVLFLFVVMMLDVDIGSLRDGFWSHFPVAAHRRRRSSRSRWRPCCCPASGSTDAPAADAAALKLGNTKLLGIEVYTHYLYPLQIAAVLLLVAIIAAISLTLRARKDTKRHDPSRAGQGARRPTACASCTMTSSRRAQRAATTRAERHGRAGWRPPARGDDPRPRRRSATTCRSARSCSRCR